LCLRYRVVSEVAITEETYRLASGNCQPIRGFAQPEECTMCDRNCQSTVEQLALTAVAPRAAAQPSEHNCHASPALSPAIAQAAFSQRENGHHLRRAGVSGQTAIA